MNQLIEKVTTAFKQKFQVVPMHCLQAPGRVNLMGEHTDYNDGFVLPCAIDYQTVVACRPRRDNTVNVYALDFKQTDSFSIDDAIPLSGHLWANYVRGVVQFLRTRGHFFNGADIVLASDVPQGAGLSSSAALEVVIGLTFKTLYGLPVDETELALIGQQAESDYIGCRCGIMDQLASTKGQADEAMLIDCRDLSIQAVKVPESLAIMVINSNQQRGLVNSEYNARRQQCEAVAEQLGVKALRDASLADLKRANITPGGDAYHRAHHVISENARALAMAKALPKADLSAISELMAASHASMRSDFEISVPAIDYLVSIVSDVLDGQGGARMTGGGFGGCVVVLAPREKMDAVRQAVAEKYTAHTGLEEKTYLCKPSAGAGLIRL